MILDRLYFIFLSLFLLFVVFFPCDYIIPYWAQYVKGGVQKFFKKPKKMCCMVVLHLYCKFAYDIRKSADGKTQDVSIDGIKYAKMQKNKPYFAIYANNDLFF